MFENKKKIFNKNWCLKAGELLSEQLSMSYQAFYFYTEFYTHFSSRKVALNGLASYYKKKYLKKLEQAQDILDFMIKRGFEVVLKPINPQNFDEFETISDIIKFSKEYEELILANVNFTNKKEDWTIYNFLKDFIKYQVDEIYELDCLYENAKRCQNTNALFLFDNNLLK